MPSGLGPPWKPDTAGQEDEETANPLSHNKTPLIQPE